MSSGWQPEEADPPGEPVGAESRRPGDEVTPPEAAEAPGTPVGPQAHGVGDLLRVEVTRIAHGGHCVARAESGQVVFVRHALPGELVDARVTRGKAGDRFLFADAEQVLRPSSARVEPPCPYAGPGGCGGCDFQHVDLATQRVLKADVVREQLTRFAGLDREVEVTAVPGDEEGLRWRTRTQFAVDARGRAGLRPHHSHDVVPLDDCLLSTRAVIDTGVLDQAWPGRTSIEVIAPSVGEPVVLPVDAEGRWTGGQRRSRRRGRDRRAAGGPPRKGKRPGRSLVREQVNSARWSGTVRVDARGFWQVHPGAAATLVDQVLADLRPTRGDRVLDLYAGVGLFGRALADLVGPEGAVLAVESDRAAVQLAARDCADVEQLEWSDARVEAALAPLIGGGDRVDLVVLDPPRSGAGRRVVTQIARVQPRVISYVACDPAALARDLAFFAESGYQLTDLHAFDLFPMTQHVECVARLTPGPSTP